MEKLVSVIIPTYGGGKFINNAIESVLNQTYKNLEIVVVDDNGIGTDNQLSTQTNIQKYIECGAVEYICHETNKNGAAARNTGVKNSKGEYIALLDDDDTYTKNNIEEQVRILESLPLDYALTYCLSETYQNGKVIRVSSASYEGSVLFELLCHKFAIGSSSLLIRRSGWEELGGFDESFRRHQDYEFTARVAAKYKVKAVNNVGMHYNLEFRNAPKSAHKAKEYRMHYLEKMMPLIRTLPKKQQKIVIVNNRLDVALQFLKEKNIKAFLKEYKDTKPGIEGIKFMGRRFYKVIQHGGIVKQ